MSDRLPTEAEVAEWRKKPFLTIGQDRRLLALVEAVMPIVEENSRLADGMEGTSYFTEETRKCRWSQFQAQAVWRRWKGEA